jgi:hypothetical protein
MRRIGRDDLLSVFDETSLTERFDPAPAAPDAHAVAALRMDAATLLTGLNKRIRKQVR